MSVMDSLCSSRTSDRVILLPLLGTSNTRIAPDETPGKREKETLDCRVLYFGYSYKYTSLCAYPHIYNSPTLPISLERTWPELGHKTSSVNAQDFGMKLWSNTFLSHMNMYTNVGKAKPHVSMSKPDKAEKCCSCVQCPHRHLGLCSSNNVSGNAWRSFITL